MALRFFIAFVSCGWPAATRKVELVGTQHKRTLAQQNAPACRCRLHKNLHQCRGKNCAELLTSKDARSSHSNLDLRLIVQNHVQQRAMDCNAAVVIDEL
jgi:hypothetical protein